MNLDVHLKYTISNPLAASTSQSVSPRSLRGCGIRGGALYGKSDKVAAYPESDPVHPQDIQATVLHALGVPLHGPADNTEIKRPNFTTGKPINAISG